MSGHRGRLLRLASNRVWRTYDGGRTLDRIEGAALPADGPYPEDWIGSTVRAINPGSATGREGLSDVFFGDERALLADLIRDDPTYFLGRAHVERYGADPRVLVKYLDSAVRLPFQAHPTVDFSRRFLNSDSGKTEAYHILAIRPEVAEPYIYLGFQRPPSRSELRRMILMQDIGALEACFDRIPVRTGDTFVVPGGLPHAIGGGVLMVEVMEPTDFVARIEFTVAGRVIPPEARFMNRDVEFALDMISLDASSAEDIMDRSRCSGTPSAERACPYREPLVDRRYTDRFGVFRTSVRGHAALPVSRFTILCVLQGECVIEAGYDCAALKKYDRMVIPAGLQSFRMISSEGCSLLESCSPEDLPISHPG